MKLCEEEEEEEGEVVKGDGRRGAGGTCACHDAAGPFQRYGRTQSFRCGSMDHPRDHESTTCLLKEKERERDHS